MIKTIEIAALAMLFVPCGLPAQIPAILPPNLENDEAALLTAARTAEPELLENGYRKFTLVAARLAAWTEDQTVVPKELEVHLFLPAAERKGPYPLLVYVHGGGFMGGSPNLNLHDGRSRFSAAFRHVLDHGVAVASIGYRLAREGGWPAPVSDPLCGMRFLQQNGEHWNLMTERLVLVGHSAGARSIGLIGMVPQDTFHTQNLPWRQKPVSIAGTFLWAGSILTKPMLDSFGEFGKPRWYSVPRLHHGEHPAWDDSTRHSLRIRNNFPHISNRMPPLHMVRGDQDYGGDHSDAETAVSLWQALGIAATLDIVDGGHNAAGPPETLLAFVRKYVLEEPFTPPQQDMEKTARVLIKQDEPFGALEVLTAAHTTEGGTNPGSGHWMQVMHDTSLMWLPDHTDWPEAHQALARGAREQLAGLEAAAAQCFFAQSDWFRAAEAARNVRRLIGEAPHMVKLLSEIESREAREAAFFKSLYRANGLWTSGEPAAARDEIENLEDPRGTEVLRRVAAGFQPPVPVWADRHGVDLYGPWVSIDFQKGVELRLRWVEAGAWELPEHLHYQPRGRVEDTPVTRVDVAEGFWIAETEVTRAQWQAVGDGGQGGLPPESAPLPVARKDYLEIIDWLQTLSRRREDLLARLPTETEWIHAATGGGRDNVRGGTDVHAVHALNVDPDNPEATSVFAVTPDRMGLYGILGGVQEWTASGDRREARFQDQGRLRILRYPMSRGGAWSSFPHVLGVGTREGHRHGNRQPDLGFRLVIGGDATAETWLDDVVIR